MKEPDHEFLKEEYNRKWDYVMHTEVQREKYIQWYLLVSGAVLAFLFKDLKDLQDIVGNDSYYIGLGFLVVYSILLKLILLFQKKIYALYTDRLVSIENTFCMFDHPFLRYKDSRIFTAFRTIFSSIVLMGSGFGFLLVYSIAGNLIISCSIAGIYFVISMGATFLAPFRH